MGYLITPNCTGCGDCLPACSAHAIYTSDYGTPYKISKAKCTNCGVCLEECSLGYVINLGDKSSIANWYDILEAYVSFNFLYITSTGYNKDAFINAYTTVMCSASSSSEINLFKSVVTKELQRCPTKSEIENYQFTVNSTYPTSTQWNSIWSNYRSATSAGVNARGGNLTIDGVYANNQLVKYSDISFISYTPVIIVTFDANGGSTTSPSSKEVTNGEAYGDLPTPTWSNHTVTIEASFNLNGKSINQSAPVSQNTTATASHTFRGWSLVRNSTNYVTSSTIVTETESHTLYATWLTRIMPSLTVTFPSAVTATSGEVLEGWSTKANPTSSDIIFEPGSTTTIVENTTFYAVWGLSSGGEIDVPTLEENLSLSGTVVSNLIRFAYTFTSATFSYKAQKASTWTSAGNMNTTTTIQGLGSCNLSPYMALPAGNYYCLKVVLYGKFSTESSNSNTTLYYYPNGI